MFVFVHQHTLRQTLPPERPYELPVTAKLNRFELLTAGSPQTGSCHNSGLKLWQAPELESTDVMGAVLHNGTFSFVAQICEGGSDHPSDK